MARKRIVWSDQSTMDLTAIADYIAKDSQYYAAAYVRELRDASRSLGQLSERGRIVPEIGDNSIRELFVYSYRLVYQVRGEEVVILGIIHGKRDLKRVWGERGEGKP